MYYYNKSSEGALQRSKYKEQIGECFNYTLDFQFLDIVAETLEAFTEEEIKKYTEDMIREYIDRITISTPNNWIIMEHYEEPNKANLEEAIIYLEEDIERLVEIIKEKEPE